MQFIHSYFSYLCNKTSLCRHTSGERLRMGLIALVTGKRGASGYGSASTAEQVSRRIDASKLTAIVTGGASGIGVETVRVLALRGARVVIGARNLDAAIAVKEDLLQQIKGARIHVLRLDLASMDSVRKFAKDFDELNLPLNILINNAGIMFCPFKLSEDGLEMHFATNHVGHFLLTSLLLDKMKKTAKDMEVEGRIVNLSSIAHMLTYNEGIRFNRINDETGYSDKKAYGQSKLANILHACELSRKLKEEGANVTANAVHPGFIMTNLMRYSMTLMRVLKFFSSFLWKNVPQGAATTIYVALHPDLNGVSGRYFADCNEVIPSPFSRDKELAKNLWEVSTKLVKYQVG